MGFQILPHHHELVLSWYFFYEPFEVSSSFYAQVQWRAGSWGERRVVQGRRGLSVTDGGKHSKARVLGLVCCLSLQLLPSAFPEGPSSMTVLGPASGKSQEVLPGFYDLR